MKKLITPVFTSACVLATGAASAMTIVDPGFDAAFTDVGGTFSEADSANYDKWVYQDDTNISAPREWSQEASGGNLGGYADGTFGNSNSYRRALYQGVTDAKATQGVQNLTFDLNLFDLNDDNTRDFEVAVWGVADTGGSYTFALSTTGSVTMDADSGDAVNLAYALYEGTTGWQGQSISVDFGTGYDLVIIGFKSNNYKTGDDTVGIDNVAVVPEPGSLALLGLGGLLIARRRRG